MSQIDTVIAKAKGRLRVRDTGHSLEHLKSWLDVRKNYFLFSGLFFFFHHEVVAQKAGGIFNLADVQELIENDPEVSELIEPILRKAVW